VADKLITSGSFPIVAAWLFLTIVILVPLISLVALRREQNRIAGDSYRKPITAVFLAEVWLWLIAAVIAGFLLSLFFGFYIFVNAHDHATGNERVPYRAMILVFGIDACLVFAGWLLHRFMKHLMS
jgi:hypothetical protein